jgi:hypothetical protein
VTKDPLDELELVWRVEIADNRDKQWNHQHEKLVEFKRKNGHWIVPKRYEQDRSSLQVAVNLLALRI